MLKNVRKSQILLSIAIIALLFVLLGNVHSLATESGSSNTVTITATTQNTSTPDNTNTNTNISTNTNGVSNISSIVSAPSNSTDQTANNTSTYNNTNTTSDSSGLPYTGTNSKAMLLIVAFIISAVYAYKKVSDYNF